MRPLATAMPYADIAVFLYALLAAGLAFAHSSEMPSARAWSHDHVLLYAQFGVFILLGLTQLAVLVFERPHADTRSWKTPVSSSRPTSTSTVPRFACVTSESICGPPPGHPSRATCGDREAFSWPEIASAPASSG